MSQREAEVLEALGAHLSNAQIAGRLHISVRTVESHVSSLLRKFGVTDRRELAELAQTVRTEMCNLPAICELDRCAPSASSTSASRCDMPAA